MSTTIRARDHAYQTVRAFSLERANSTGEALSRAGFVVVLDMSSEWPVLVVGRSVMEPVVLTATFGLTNVTFFTPDREDWPASIPVVLQPDTIARRLTAAVHEQALRRPPVVTGTEAGA